MFERAVSELHVLEVITFGEQINDYVDDKPFPSVLLLGYIGCNPLHVLVGVDQESKICLVNLLAPLCNQHWTSGPRLFSECLLVARVKFHIVIRCGRALESFSIPPVGSALRKADCKSPEMEVRPVGCIAMKLVHSSGKKIKEEGPQPPCLISRATVTCP